MKQKIVALEQQLAAARGHVEQQNANEDGLVTTFDRGARVEAARLTALRDLLATK